MRERKNRTQVPVFLHFLTIFANGNFAGRQTKDYIHLSTLKLKKSIVLLAILLSSLCSKAQFVNFGQDRPSLRWRQIKTENFQIIYPDFFETEAQKAANIYSRLYRHANTLGQRPKKIAMIMHADGGVSNGNVALAPRKSELYTMPSQEPGDAWLEHLCTHEFRHVVQFDKINQGLTHGLYYLFGEIFPIAVVGVYLPMWFIEGDAVCFETSVGHVGRGRSPEFLGEMKAQMVEKGIYSFPKAILGSQKDYVPNRYNMGYFMTANTRRHYGSDVWAKALERTGRRPFGITSFDKSLKLTMQGKRDSLWQEPGFRSLFANPDSVKADNRHSGAKHTLYYDNFTELRQRWLREAAGKRNDFDTISTCNKYYAGYYYPTPLPDGGVLAYKEGLRETGAFVLLQGGKERLLTRTGSMDDRKFATDGNRIVWSEYRPHVRWDQGGRMRLSSYDLKKGKYRRHRGANNQFAPFSADGGWGYVETDNRNRSYLVLADSSLQREVWRLAAGEGEHFIHPSWHAGKITVAVQSPRGMRLESIDIATRERRRLTEDLHYELDNPLQLDDSTYVYRASYDTDNAFYRLRNGRTEKIAEGRYGVRFPAYGRRDSSLYFSFYTSDGYKPARLPAADWEADSTIYATYPLADLVTAQEGWKGKFTYDSIFPSRKYNKFTHLPNIHSWAPLYASLSPIGFDFGATVYSQNKLSTLSFTAGYIKDSGYEHGNWLVDLTYSGWWPVVSLTFKSGRENYTSQETGTLRRGGVDMPLYVTYKAQRSSADITMQFPFNLSARQFNRSLRPYVRYQIEGIHGQRPQELYAMFLENDTLWLAPVQTEDYDIQFGKRYYQLMEYGITFSNQARMTDQEINPRWGQVLTAGYTHALSQGLHLGEQWWTAGQFYFPGVAANHSLALYGGFQHMSDRTRNYSNKISYPRGISLYGYEIATFRGSYHFPIAYPDQHISSILYFKNINGCVFYDFGTSKSLTGTEHHSSYGLELTTDTHFFRLTYPIHLGVRAGYQTQSESLFAEFIFSIGLSI